MPAPEADVTQIGDIMHVAFQQAIVGGSIGGGDVDVRVEAKAAGIAPAFAAAPRPATVACAHAPACIDTTGTNCAPTGD